MNYDWKYDYQFGAKLLKVLIFVFHANQCARFLTRLKFSRAYRLNKYAHFMRNILSLNICLYELLLIFRQFLSASFFFTILHHSKILSQKV